MGDDPVETILYIALGVLLVAFAALVVVLSMPSLVRRVRDHRHARLSNARRAAHTGIDLFSAPSEPKGGSHRRRRRSRWWPSRKRNQKIDLFGKPQE